MHCRFWSWWRCASGVILVVALAGLFTLPAAAGWTLPLLVTALAALIALLYGEYRYALDPKPAGATGDGPDPLDLLELGGDLIEMAGDLSDLGGD